MVVQNLRQFFEEDCQKRYIKLFVPPFDSPELNGYVERAHLTHAEESYEVANSSFNIPELTDKLLNWEKLHNTSPSHQSLDCLTPQECLECYSEDRRKEVMCH